VDEDEIAYVVSKWTGIPIVKIEEKESERLLRIEDVMHEKVIASMRRSGLSPKPFDVLERVYRIRKRPIGSFLFLGPTGTGKTHLAKILAEFMFGMKMP
jgi:ATP-dependent Clp protease ATP-binding subunit ClpC